MCIINSIECRLIELQQTQPLKNRPSLMGRLQYVTTDRFTKRKIIVDRMLWVETVSFCSHALASPN